MKILKKHIIVFLLLSLLLSMAFTVYADTDGTELQIGQPSKLILQLGPAWAGVEFELKTDYGLYPGKIIVDEAGVLKTELGGSKTYILSCFGTPTDLPAPEDNPEIEVQTEVEEVLPQPTNVQEEIDPDNTETGEKDLPGKDFFFLIGGTFLGMLLMTLAQKEINNRK